MFARPCILVQRVVRLSACGPPPRVDSLNPPALRRPHMPSARPTQHSIRVFTTLVLVVAAIALASLAVPATAQTYTVLHNYSAVGPRNFQYSAALVQGRDGNLYGTSSQGGTSALGTVFSISLLGADTTLHSFDGTTGTNTSWWSHAGVGR